MRSIRFALEEAAGEQIDEGPGIWQWLVELAADTFYRYAVGSHGATFYTRVNGRESNVPVVRFGERA